MWSARASRAPRCPSCFPRPTAPKVWRVALDKLFAAADQVIADGVNIIILSDRGIDAQHAPIPALLAVSGLHHHLIRAGTRGKVGLVLESGEPREVHHFALLIGYGCSAINPYLAFETLDDMIREGLLLKLDHKTAVKKYIKAAVKGVVKTMAKMGISTIQSYRGAQIFEAVGLNSNVVDKYFTWTPSRIQGVGMDVLAEEVLARHRHAFPDRPVNRPSCSTRRPISMARGRRISFVQSADDSQIANRLPPQQRKDLPGIRRVDQPAGGEPLHPARPAGFQICGKPDSDRGGRVGGGNREAVQDRRDELRLDFARKRTRRWPSR